MSGYPNLGLNMNTVLVLPKLFISTVHTPRIHYAQFIYAVHFIIFKFRTWFIDSLTKNGSGSPMAKIHKIHNHA